MRARAIKRRTVRGVKTSATGNLFAALRHRQFALLWSGQAGSRAGDHIYTVVLPLWVRQETGSASTMGLVLLCTVLPAVILMPVAGALVDRMSRPRVMFASDLVRGGAALSIGLAEAAGVLELPFVLVASIAFGLAQAFFQPAYVAVVPQVTPRDDLQSANSLTALSQQIAAVLGPAIGAALLFFAGAAAGFVINGLSFLVSAATLAAMDWRAIRPEGGSSRVIDDVREGITTVRSEPWIWYTILLAGLANITLTGPMRVALPFHLDAERDMGWAFGAILAAGAAGSVVMALAIGRRKGRLRRRGLLAYLAWQANGLMLVALASGLPAGFLLFAALGGGAALTLFELIWVGTLQDMVPVERLGRVASIDYVVSFGFLPLGGVAVGLATDAFSGAEVLAVCGAITAVVPLLGLFAVRIRQLD